MISKKGLGLDGGGVLGAGQAAILGGVPDLSSKFDFVTGTSVGAIMAALVASGQSADALGFFSSRAPDIFAGYWWRHYKPWTPRYNDSGLNLALRQSLSGQFKDLAIPTFIPVADLSRRRLKVFCSTDKEDGEWPLWEVIRAAVAAETYFLPWKGYADGGIYANNPAMVGTIGASCHFGIPVEQIELCSIGTGRSIKNSNVGSTRGWTFFRWGIYLITSMLDGAANTMHEFFVSKLPLKRYVRIQFERDPGWHIDNPYIVRDILDAWQFDIETATHIVNTF